ncbi:hypothetical protein FHG87_016076 [Trinorchestia longiramus]|nr:hypothetical protein FHG87_016076 [Trinorchestia longiramus]
MTSGKGRALSSARNDCLAPERIDTLDYEHLVQSFYEKQKFIKQLQKQLDEINQQVAACVAVLLCSNNNQLSEALEQQGALAPPTAVTLETCQAVTRCQHAEQQVSLHKLLGAEIMQVTGGTLLCMIHTQDVRADSLPLQLFTITKVPDSEFYRMRPREIMYHLGLDVALRNLMVRSSHDDIIHCFRNMQSLIFDLVTRDNVYQALSTEKCIQLSLTCSKNRKLISFTLPTTTTLTGREGVSHVDAVQLKSIKSLMSQISVSVQYDAAAARGWKAQLYCSQDPQLKEIPDHVDRVLRKFLSSLPDEDVVTCVRVMLRELCGQYSFLDSSDGEESRSSGEFAGIF